MSFIVVDGVKYVDEPGLIDGNGHFTKPPILYSEPKTKVVRAKLLDLVAKNIPQEKNNVLRS